MARGVLGASRWVGRIVERGAEWARGVTGILFYFILFYFILFYFILFCFVLFYFILFYFILFYFILFYFILFYFILFYFILFYFILFYFILFYFILFYFILFYFILFYFILFYFILFYFILFYFILFYFILFYFVLFYFISFHFISFHFISFHFISFYFISSHFFLSPFPFNLLLPSKTGIQEEGRKYHRTHSSDLLSCFDQVCQAIKDIIEEEEGEGEREGDGEGERTRERKKKNIFVTGHSLGGALASLFVAKGLSEGIFEEEKTEGNTGGEEGRGVERRRKSGGRGLGKLGGLYTFGAPKVGNGEFGELFEGISERVFRIVLRYDIVPHVPTTNMYIFFSFSFLLILDIYFSTPRAQTADHIARWLQSSVDPNIILDDCQQHQHHHNQLCYMHPPSEFLFLSRGVLLTNPSLFEMVKAQMTGFFDRKLFQVCVVGEGLCWLFRLILVVCK